METSTLIENSLLLRAARGEPVDRVPVWMMRQAGRYLPEYRALRAGKDFFETCRDPELVAEITLQPLRRFPLDAAIIFSDILVVPQAMGMEVKMISGIGPRFVSPLRNERDIAGLAAERAADRLGYVYDAIATTTRALDASVPLIGFAGAPWTLIAYMIEGEGTKTFSRARAWFYREPAAIHRLLDRVTGVLGEYLVRQIEAGAAVVQIFDSWAGLLTPDLYDEFGLPYLGRLAGYVADRYPDVPRTIFAKGAHYALESLAESPFNVISLDWTIDPRQARIRTGERVALQGNLDPCVLYSSPETIRQAVQEMVGKFGKKGYIANLGHGLRPDHDPEHVSAFVDAVRSA